MNIWQRIFGDPAVTPPQNNTQDRVIFMREYILDILARVSADNASFQWGVGVIYFLISVAIALCILFLARILIHFLLTPLISRSKNRVFALLLKNKVFRWLAHIAPLYVLYLMLPAVFDINSAGAHFFRDAFSIALLLCFLRVILAVLNTLRAAYQMSSLAKDYPINGYIQVVKVASITVAILLIVGTIVNVSVGHILGGLGAFSALILLIFRDPILALLASAQLSFNNMVRIGDWITISDKGADGTVVDVNLQSVRIQNWDRSITSIPIYHLISNSFTNWRGMEQSGGRRIKRAINIDMHTVSLCTPDMIAEFERYMLLNDYISHKKKEIDTANAHANVFSQEDVLSTRAMTNLGTFRAYAYMYLQQHPDINQDMTCMVRQLHPTDHGIPIEFYCFSAEKDWVKYESIQADILDHLIAIVPVFQLRIFQSPSGNDFQTLHNQNQEHVR